MAVRRSFSEGGRASVLRMYLSNHEQLALRRTQGERVDGTHGDRYQA